MDAIAHLRSVPLFRELDEQALQHVAQHVTEVSVPVGSVVIEVGQPGNGLLVLEEGILVVEAPGGREIELGAGEFVGEIALLTDHPHSARVRAGSDVTCLAIARADFARLLQEQPRIAVAMLPVLAARLSDSL